ncbi:uncharacterized protein LOC131701871 [Acipenser ruthenus]|uniref:uncharacterized protein LOC131701871 n=1 Tax=Acipenser ruthenus TaxID=7906 RepID=UPI00145B1946|nr:uncharacterized protein LOC131701871 [Acipenser ruthenus]
MIRETTVLGLASEAAVQLSGTEEEGHAGIQADNATADKDSPVAVLQLQHGAPVQQGELQELQHQGASVEGLQQHQGPPVQQGALQELMQEQPVEVLQSQEQLVQQGEPVQERGRAGEQDAMFETLCSELLSAISLLNTSMSEILDLKEELLSHTLPGSLLIRLAVATGRLFRSCCDVFTPGSELVRLVRRYSAPWEQSREVLQKLHAHTDRSQGLLSVAVRRLQLLDANSRRTHQQQRVQDWERLFAKLMSSKTVGGRWRFRLDSLKQRDLEGRLLDSRPPHSAPVWPERGGAETQEAADGLTDREEPGSDSDREGRVSDEADSDVDSEHPLLRETVDMGTQTDRGTEDTESQTDRGTEETETQTDRGTEDRQTWTGDPQLHRSLCVGVSAVTGSGSSCESGLWVLVSYGGQQQRMCVSGSGVGPGRKHVRISEGEPAPPAGVSSVAPPSGILRTSPPKQDPAPGAAGEEELRFQEEACSRTLGVSLYRHDDSLIGEGCVSLPQDVPSVRGSVLGSPQCHSVSVPLFSGQAPQLSASLTLSLRWLEEELPRWAHRTTQAWSLAEVLLQATGVDLSELSPEELLQRLQRPALSEACTSPIAWPRQEPQLWDSSTAPVASLLTGPELQDACCSALSPQLGLEQALAHCVRELDQVKEEHSRAIAELKERHRRQVCSLLEREELAGIDPASSPAPQTGLDPDEGSG